MQFGILTVVTRLTTGRVRAAFLVNQIDEDRWVHRHLTAGELMDDSSRSRSEERQ
jgi:hypothetical protein